MDAEKIKRKYHRTARFYDQLIAPTTERLRAEAVQKLGLQIGDHVLDLGCGTGLSIPFLRRAVGDSGVVYGVELSPDMLARAREKVETAGWQNIRLIEANAESFVIDDRLDGILCFYTHDIMLSPTALPRAVELLKPDGRVVAAGGKLARGPLGWLINPITIAYSLPAVTTLDRARSHEPFAVLQRLLTDVHVEERKLGSQYLAWGAKEPK